MKAVHGYFEYASFYPADHRHRAKGGAIFREHDGAGGALPVTLTVKVRFTTLTMGDGGVRQVATDTRFDSVCVTTFDVAGA